MKKLLFYLFLIAIISKGKSQTIEFKVNGANDTIVNLAKYFGDKLYYADTSEFKNGVVKFDGSKHEPGVYAMIIPNHGYFELILNNEDVKLETKVDDYINSMKITKSNENKGFYEFIHFMNDQRKKNEDLRSQMANNPDDENLKNEMESIGNEVKNFQKSFQKDYNGTLVAKIMKMTYEVDFDQEALTKMDSIQRYTNYLETYFDNIDFKDDRLVKSPIFHNKLDNFFSEKTLIQNPDSISKYCDHVIGKTIEGSEMFKYVLHHVTYKYETSKIMGMDQVFAHLANTYYCPDPNTGKSKAFWLSEDKQEKICERGSKLSPLLIGKIAPNLILTDTTEKKWVNLHELEREYIVLYFWDPNCGHCKKETPKLNEIYINKLKDLNIEVFAVGKAMRDDFEAWKKFIREKNLSFLNVGLTKNIYDIAIDDARQLVPKYTTVESLNYSDTYDIFSTPKVFIIDKDKKFVAKQLSVEQIEEFFDKVLEKKSHEK